MLDRRFLMITLGAVASLALSRPSVAEDPNDFLVPFGAGPQELRPIASAVAKQRQSEGGKVVISIPREYMGNRNALILNERIKAALIFADVPPDWTASYYYSPKDWRGNNPHQVWISIVDFHVNLNAATVPRVPSLVGVDGKQFADEAQAAKMASSPPPPGQAQALPGQLSPGSQMLRQHILNRMCAGYRC